MKRLASLIVLFAVAAPFASASDLRHLRFASTPGQAANPTAVENGSAPVYSLTGPASPATRRAPGVANTWVVGTPNFHPGK